jgi:hypothetical protein
LFLIVVAGELFDLELLVDIGEEVRLGLRTNLLTIGILVTPTANVRSLGALKVGPRDTAPSIIPTQMHPLR